MLKNFQPCEVFLTVLKVGVVGIFYKNISVIYTYFLRIVMRQVFMDQFIYDNLENTHGGSQHLGQPLYLSSG